MKFPNSYKVSYNSHLSCQWTIDLRSHSGQFEIELIFSNVELEYSEPDCRLDFVQIFGRDLSFI